MGILPRPGQQSRTKRSGIGLRAASLIGPKARRKGCDFTRHRPRPRSPGSEGQPVDGVRVHGQALWALLSQNMEKNIIERAYELAPTCDSIEDVRIALSREGYSNVDAHLAGRVIRADLAKLLSQKPTAD